MSTGKHQPAPAVGELEDITYGEDYCWMVAVSQYLDGNTEPLSAMLRGSEAVTVSADARALLADLVEGKLPKSKGGRPVERSKRVERAIVYDFYTELERQVTAFGGKGKRAGGPTSAAIALVAERRGLEEDAVRGVIDRVRIKEGITREKWAAWGRPNWQA